MEANFPIEEKRLPRGDTITYCFGVMNNQKFFKEVASRYLCIPSDPRIKGEANEPSQHG